MIWWRVSVSDAEGSWSVQVDTSCQVHSNTARTGRTCVLTLPHHSL